MEDTPNYAGAPGGTAEFLQSPRLDVHPGGFGLVLGGESGAGIRARALLLPARDGVLQSCTILARLVPSRSGGGILFRAEADSPGPALELFLTEGRPSVILRSGDRSGEVRSAALLVPSRPVLLGVTLRPEGPALRISFLVDGTPAGEGSLPFGASGWAGDGTTTVAGPDGYPGLYDEVGVWAFDDLGDPSVYPAFLYASRRSLGPALVWAEGFEGTYGPPSVLSGGASVEAGAGLALPAGSGARFGQLPEGTLEVEAALSAGPAPALVIHGSEGSVVLPWKPGVLDMDPGTGLPLLRARIRPAEEGGGLTVSSGEETVRVSGAGPWSLGLAGPGAGISRVRSIRVYRPARAPGE